MVSKVSPNSAEDLIEKEREKQRENLIISKIMHFPFAQELHRAFNISYEDIVKVFSDAESFHDLGKRVDAVTGIGGSFDVFIDNWDVFNSLQFLTNINSIRDLLQLPPLISLSMES
ncbi:hypothetical protein CTT31_06485 [Pseudoalteromonas maricaloris]|uniref:hypothetical protein n=1 Tax=Pseudoalteromonas maricaloris TaxID=184924 RepID=UPI0021AE166B|nr:hypothetical protein [Pseudoalteromonas flavipulchra]USE68786.1 hypothetical protein CTT31_06485 [Pseudoalteromonas flavipulchra]